MRTSPSLNLRPISRTMRRLRTLDDGQPASCLQAKECHHAGHPLRPGCRGRRGDRARAGRRSAHRARAGRAPLRRLDRPDQRPRALQGVEAALLHAVLARAPSRARAGAARLLRRHDGRRPPRQHADLDRLRQRQHGRGEPAWTVSNTAGCNGGAQFSAASMPSGWNDRVSSSQSAHGCAHNRHFHDTNFGGVGINCTCATMGTMNNQTSSETWSQ